MALFEKQMRSAGRGTFSGEDEKGFKVKGSSSTCLPAHNNGQRDLRNNSSVTNKAAYGFKMRPALELRWAGIVVIYLFIYL